MKQTIAITSAKTGQGKTFFAISLACALSYIKNKVLFFDADFGPENINDQLNLNLLDEMAMVLTNKKTLNQIIVKNTKPSFDIISSHGGVFKLVDLPKPRLDIIMEDLEILSQNYDSLIIDMPSSKILRYNFSSLIILCNDEPSSIARCFELVKTNKDKNIDIVINFANSHIDGKRVFENIARACVEHLNVVPNFLGVIRKDSRVRDAIRNKTSIISRYPNSDASLDIFNIAKRIVSDAE